MSKITYDNLNDEFKEYFDKLEIEQTDEKVEIFYELMRISMSNFWKQVNETIIEDFELKHRWMKNE